MSNALFASGDGPRPDRLSRAKKPDLHGICAFDLVEIRRLGDCFLEAPAIRRSACAR
jgi:hypothetical protein